MNGLVAYDSSDSETEEQQEFEGHLGHLKKQTPEITKSPPKRKPSAGSIASPVQKPLGHSLLASEYQLKLLSTQRSQAAKAGSKKRIFITAPSYQDDDLDEEKPKKAKITASKSRSSLLSKLPKAANDSATMTSKLDIKPIGSTSGPSSSTSGSTEDAEPAIKPSKPMSTTMFMPNSTKNRLQSQNKKSNEVKPEIRSSKKKKDEEDSDDDEPFFSFTSKEEETKELKSHKLEAGPSRPSRDLIRNQRSVFAAPPVEGEENMAVYGSTREPEEEESAIAPYGSDISVYNQIAGPSSRVNADGSRKMSDAGLDIDGDAIRHLQGRRREDVQFIEAKVDASLGNIRENIRKGANQKHISTSMVDPLKQMKKSDPNAHVSKRTHQLKYLVELAKANETRLDQLWSNAKASNRSTAMKYGW